MVVPSVVSNHDMGEGTRISPVVLEELGIIVGLCSVWRQLVRTISVPGGVEDTLEPVR